MKPFTQAEWLRFQQAPQDFIGRVVNLQMYRHRFSRLPPVVRRGTIAKYTKSNMVGVVLDGEKNITSFSYNDLWWDDE